MYFLSDMAVLGIYVRFQGVQYTTQLCGDHNKPDPY